MAPSANPPEITENVFSSDRHETAYLACGPEDGTPVIFAHGWPDLSYGWRHQLRFLGALGLRAIAPDMRGYGGSQVHDHPIDYTIEALETDLLELADHLGASRAVWVGHDWGAPIIWSVAQHHPERCLGVVSLCVPYMPNGFTSDEVIQWSDRKLYPEDKFPAAQWDYWKFYQTNFEDARQGLEANIQNTVRALFRAGHKDAMSMPAVTASVTARGGWFGPKGAPAPAFPRDKTILTEEDEARYVAAFSRTGFTGPDSWYLNDDTNKAYADLAKDNRRLPMPVFFVHGAYDSICETLQSDLAKPMRDHCRDFTETTIEAGHWVAQEKPDELNAALEDWFLDIGIL